jgi:hypothetical protein
MIASGVMQFPVTRWFSVSDYPAGFDVITPVTEPAPRPPLSIVALDQETAGEVERARQPGWGSWSR